MATFTDKNKAIIRKHETRLANLISREVVEKPKLTIWMILIPIVFVYYFYGLNRYKTGKRGFVKNFLYSRDLVLDLAVETLKNGKQADFDALARQEHVPEESHESYKQWAKALFNHYLTLLRATGDNHEDLVQSCYTGKEDYLQALNGINRVEKQFYKSLRRSLKEDHGGVGDVIRKMETALTGLRQDEADFVFAS